MTLISQSLDGKRVGYKGNVYVAVPDGMTPDDALARLDATPAPLPDNAREAAERLRLDTESGLQSDRHNTDLRTLLTHLTPAPTTGQRKKTDEHD